MKKLTFIFIFTGLLFGAIACQANVSTENSDPPASEPLPGDGVTVRPIRISVPEDHFQTEVINKALEKLGYEVEETAEVLAPSIMFTALANGDVDYTPVHWERIFTKFYEKSGGSEKLEKMGILVTDTVQGYQIDKKTAEKYNITSLDQLEDPEIAKLFDSDGNGKADLTGCPPGWGCEFVVEHHLDTYGLRETVDHNQGEYALLIADAIARYKQGESILVYTWVPMWVGQVLKPGEDTIWLEVPYTSLPEEQGEVSEEDTTFQGKNLGFAVDRIRITANKEFINANPAAKKLFELIEIPIEDINAQNLRMREGEDKLEDISRHAEEWIEQNQETFDSWIEEAGQVKPTN